MKSFLKAASIETVDRYYLYGLSFVHLILKHFIIDLDDVKEAFIVELKDRIISIEFDDFGYLKPP